MIASPDITAEELLRARLSCSKLAKLLRGMLSVGLGALQLPAPAAFFAGRDQPILALVEVLAHTGVRPASASAAELRATTSRLSREVSSFFAHLTALANWRGLTPEELQHAAGQLTTAYANSLTTLRQLTQALGDAADFQPQLLEGRTLVDCTLAALSHPAPGP